MLIDHKCSCLENPKDRGAWWAAVHGVAKSQTWLSDFTFTFHFHALEKEMATHSSVLVWRIPGTGEPGGLPSVGSHRVGHDWSSSSSKEPYLMFSSISPSIFYNFCFVKAAAVLWCIDTDNDYILSVNWGFWHDGESSSSYNVQRPQLSLLHIKIAAVFYPVSICLLHLCLSLHF